MNEPASQGHRLASIGAHELGELGLRDRLHDLWVAVTDAGGSVGFAAPADRAAIGRSLDDELRLVSRGTHLMAVARDGDEVVAMGFLWGRDNPLFAHWRTVMRLMVHPDVQGQGIGSSVLTALHDLASVDGCDHLVLSVRGGEGLEPFYERHGYVEIGRHVGAVRMPDGTDRDEIQFLRQFE